MVNVVIGSWGSYNACNERALGSKWLDLSDYNTWEEIAEELKKEGFKLNGIHYWSFAIIYNKYDLIVTIRLIAKWYISVVAIMFFM